MPSAETLRRASQAKGFLIADSRRMASRMVMDETFSGDTQGHPCYIYDYYHDDQPWLSEGMTYPFDTTKTKIDIKFIKTQNQTTAKDAIEYQVMFRPSQKVSFKESDELYYYETDYRKKYGSRFPIGMFIDIPDEEGVYRKWMFCGIQDSNEFTKYIVLPCNYYLHWIEHNNGKKIKHKIWGAFRSQSSYNSGLWKSDIMTQTENQNKIWLPLNPTTETIYYTNEDEKTNQRLIMSAPIKHPNVWKVSKIESTSPFGLLKVTAAQDRWNEDTDYVADEYNPDGTKDIFAMYANYYSSTVEPVHEEAPIEPTLRCEITCSTDSIKAGGGYKLLTARFLTDFNEDVTDSMTNITWKCFIDGVEYTTDPLITWLPQSSDNVKKIKFAKNKDFLTKKLRITCSSDQVRSGYIELEILAL